MKYFTPLDGGARVESVDFQAWDAKSGGPEKSCGPHDRQGGHVVAKRNFGAESVDCVQD